MQKRYLPVLLVVVLLVPQFSLGQVGFENVSSGADVNQTNTALQDAKLSLQQGPTHYEYVKYQMLRHKIKAQGGDTEQDSYRSYALRPSGMSPLSREYSGVPLNTSGISYNSFSGSQSIDLVTGARAIDESLQLGSIRPRTTREEQILNNQLNQIRRAVELYYNSNQSRYPVSLSQLELPDTIDLSQFSYEMGMEGLSYALEIIKPAEVSVPIATVEGLTIEHHPWEEMIGDRVPNVPDVYKVVPQDNFFIHFNNLGRYRELEETISQITGPLTQVYGIGESLSTQARIFDRLGIVDNPDLDIFLDEVVFMSYDFDGYPATDYALVLKSKAAMLDTLIENHLDGSNATHGSIGDYYVLASSERLFADIEKTHRGDVASMHDALDLRYSLVTLDDDKDGFAFISDAFVEKVTSPSYRIKSARRGAVLQALETLQYSVLAYRDLENRWPNRIEEMMAADYLKADSIFELEKYTISPDGVVMHDEWGSIYDVTPIMQVDIDMVRPVEVRAYNNFREGYQQLWREFIDPVAINILVGDKVKFHTIILPLIDNSEYNWIGDMVGDETGPLDFVISPDRIPAVQIASRFDIDSVLTAIYRSSPRSYDEAYRKCRQNYFSNRNRLNGPTLSEACEAAEVEDDTAAANMVRASVAEMIDWEGSEVELFSFVGDEIALGASEDVQFLIDDLTNFDVYFGVELSDVADAQVFLDHVFTWIAQELFGGGSAGMGLFGVQPGKPIKNAYNNVEYYVVPTGWINLFYIFMDDRVYFTLSQNTINALIEGERGQAWPSHMGRLLDYLDPRSDVSLLLDGDKLDVWLSSFLRDQLSSYGAGRDFEYLKAYIKEFGLVQSVIGNNEADSFYSDLPNQWLGIPLMQQGQDATLMTADGPILISDISSYRYYPYGSSQREYEYTFADIMEYVDIESILAEWGGVGTFGATLELTDEGLDIEVAFDNSERDAFDNRVPTTQVESRSEQSAEMYVIIILAVILVICSLILGYLVIRKKKAEVAGVNTMVPPENFTPTEVPPTETSVPSKEVQDQPPQNQQPPQ